MKQLTQKQQVIFDFLTQFTAQHGYPPSVREIAAAVGLKSPSTVHFHLKALEEAGAIVRDGSKTRAITAVSAAIPEEIQPEPNRIPVIGNVAAGSPILAEEHIEDYLVYDTGSQTGEHFALRIRGDSMIGAGILHDDYVVVHRQPVARNGEIVIAVLNDNGEAEATCKRLCKKNGKVWLLPENDAYDPIDGTNATLAGKVVAVVRHYN